MPEMTFTLPMDSLALVGSGKQGASLLATFGLAPALDEAAFEALVEEGTDSDDPTILASTLVCSLGRQATGWITVTDPVTERLVATVLLCHEAYLIASYRGAVIDWMVVPEAEQASWLSATTGDTPDRGILELTAFVSAEPIASYRFDRSTVGVAAQDPEALTRLTTPDLTQDSFLPRLANEIGRATQVVGHDG